MFTKVTQALAWCSNSVIILQQSAVSAEPSKLAFDNPVPNMKAATYFLPARGSVSQLGCRSVAPNVAE